jgi:hypothetical protein
MFIAYFDESGHPADCSLLTVAALVAPEKAWAAFEGKWRRILRRYRVTVFHMTDYENRQGEFAGWDIDKRIAFISDLAAIIKNTIVYGVAASIPMPFWKDSIGAFLSDERSKRTRQVPYIHLLGSCIEDIEEFVKLPKGETIACVFDQNDFIRHIVGLFYNGLVAVRGWKDVFGSLTFGDRSQVIPLQAADMMAYEAWKYAQHWDEFPSGRSRRKLLRNLSATNRLMFRRFNHKDLNAFGNKLEDVFNLLSAQGFKDDKRDLRGEFEAIMRWAEQQEDGLTDVLLEDGSLLNYDDEK